MGPDRECDGTFHVFGRCRHHVPGEPHGTSPVDGRWQQVVVSDDAGDACVHGVSKHLDRRAELLHLAAIEYRHLVRTPDRFFGSVRDVNDRCRLVGECPIEVVEERGACLRVEGGGGFVQEKDRGLHGKRPRQVHPLTLATRKPRGGALGKLGDSESFQRRQHPMLPQGTWEVAPRQRELDIAPHCGRQQAGLLRYITNGAASGQRQRLGGLAVERDRPLGWSLDSCEEPEEGGLA
jgi:hypothetical protein